MRRIRPEEVSEASEVFTSTTAGGVMPMTGINGKPIGNGHAGIDLYSCIDGARHWLSAPA